MSRPTPPAPEALTLSVIGAKHERTGRPCQDAHARGSRGSATAVAIADGHGTCARADVGASFAVEAAVEHLLEAAAHLEGAGLGLERTADLFQSQVRRQIVQEWHECVLAHAAAQGEPADGGVRAYGSTLLFALATADFVAIGQLGDGDALLVDADGRVRRPLPPESLAFAGETTSLCEPQAWLRLRVAVLPRPAQPTLVCLMTDGYTNAYASDADLDAVALGYAQLLDTHGTETIARALPGFLQKVTRGGSGDDVSLALMRLPAASAPGIPNTSGETHDSI
jgi:serine/threonine protein phosphatase PrpC